LKIKSKNLKERRSVKPYALTRFALLLWFYSHLSSCTALDPYPSACITEVRTYGTFDNSQLFPGETTCVNIDVDECKPAFQRINNLEITKVFVENENCGDLGF
jgi:hypothetical protein